MLDPITKLHLMAIVPSIPLGTLVVFRQKGDRTHMLLGRIWACFMAFACIISFFMPYPYSWLHALSAFTLYALIRGILHARNKNWPRHKRAMLGSYVALVLATFFALLMPGRYLGHMVYGLFP